MLGGLNRLGLGLRAPPPSYASHGIASAQSSDKLTTLFVGSISAGIDNAFLEQLFTVCACHLTDRPSCGTLRSFKRLLNAQNKPQAFGFAEYEEPEAVDRALQTLNGLQLPNLEDPNGEAKKLLVKADDKTKAYLAAYEAQRMRTESDEEALISARASISHLVSTIAQAGMSSSNMPNKKDAPIPPHLRDLQEADLPEEQRGLVMSEIAMFRDRAAKKEVEKRKQAEEAAQSASAAAIAMSPIGPPTGPGRGWGRGQPPPSGPHQGFGTGPQSYNRPVGFVRGGDVGWQQRRPSHGGASESDLRSPSSIEKSDWELEQERLEMRRQQEETSFRDRERRYENRERTRITQIERQIARDTALESQRERDRADMSVRLEMWDDDESDELFYTDRAAWRSKRAQSLARERTADQRSWEIEQREAEHLRLESEKFLERQMEDLALMMDEQRKAGLLLDDIAPLKLSINAAVPKIEEKRETKPEPKKLMMEEEDEEDTSKKRSGLVKLDFDAMSRGGKRVEKLETLKGRVLAMDTDEVIKTKLNWLALNDATIDAKVEPLARRKITGYLGELDDDELVMFAVEHVKDRKGPTELAEGLEPVLEEEAKDFVNDLWRQLVFESMAYAEGVDTMDMFIV
ncbi:hypothetical protein DACRYDRAFT_85786 [Dacryopinax primogenitus]|uniref:RRM domain-containing protein n=1 Tax=Dacryopinax primogenitus (strain DJM 731) TaxID=1858805 RepID=M5FYG7_DACPD|nr:uncharacterized protein DACRYDRAFT_85786 [Dacryopinax primogenitus]EJT96562.1 hypothetical protein DACRYDRAFT_85786 [Dacryopinax primogenitus]